MRYRYQSTAAANNTAANCAGNSTSDAGVKAIRYGLGNGCDFGTAGSAPIGLFNSDVPQNTSSREFMIQVTAIANNAAGSEIRSSTFRFPATICIGCNQSDAQSSEGLSCPGISACDENDPDKGFEGFQPAIEKSYCYPATRQGALEKDHTKVFTCEKLECE